MTMEIPFRSTHQLEFEMAEWEYAIPDLEYNVFKRYRIGTVKGLWGSTATTYDILAVDNLMPGNGHLEDVFQWFENSCKRDKKHLRVLELLNERFMHHLINKRGFAKIDEMNVIKYYQLM